MRRHVDRPVPRFAAAAFALLVALGVVASCKQGDDRAQATPATATASQAEAVFNVQGMHCATCPVTVRTAAKSVPGVVDVQVTMDPGRARVRFRPSETDPARIAAAI